MAIRRSVHGRIRARRGSPMGSHCRPSRSATRRSDAEIRAFVEAELRPHADEWEAARWFPDSVFGPLAERGWLGLKYGPDADWVADAVFAEELARCGSGGLAAGIGAHTSIATPPIARFGTPEQQERWLAPAIRGEKIGALAITEPDAGSDVAGARTRARKVDGGWLVNGSKTFITNGVRADFYVTAVRTREIESPPTHPPDATARCRSS